MPQAAVCAVGLGDSMRSIFERFPDLHALRVAATDHAFAVGNTLAAPHDVGSDRPTRLRSQVETRAHTCERWLPLWRALNANQRESPELKTRIRLRREMIMRRLELMYQTGLSSRQKVDRQRRLVTHKRR